MKQLEQRQTFELERGLVGQVLDRALSHGADFAELFAEDRTYGSIQVLDGKVTECLSGQDYGAGLRLLFGTEAVYAYTSDLTLENLLSLADLVGRAGARPANGADPKPLTRAPWCTQTVKPRHTLRLYPDDVARPTKVALLLKADRAARAFDPQISQVDVSVMEEIQRVFIANSEGLWLSDERPYIRLMINAIASSGVEKQSGRETPGALAGWEWLDELDAEAGGPDDGVHSGVERLARSAALTATTMLHAAYAPSGKMPVVIENGFGGVIFHEACGHLLETTSVAKGASIFTGKLGEQIANTCVTAVDDGTLDGEWGSLAVDDEGLPTQKTVLIENGILKSYMVDRLGGRKTGYTPTGSGRRQNYRFAPTSRMRNTYIAGGTSTFEAMIASIPYGLYAKKMGGGSVAPGTGDFNFAVLEGYMIRDGALAEPVRGATLIGNGADILQKIVMVGDNFAMSAGRCGSISGTIPTNVGQPALKVSEIVVGGRN